MILSEQAWADIAAGLTLSGRELEIVQATFDDQTEAAIAANLHISSHTVHTHFERLYRKLQVRGRTQLILAVVAELLMVTESADRSSPVAAEGGGGHAAGRRLPG